VVKQIYVETPTVSARDLHVFLEVETRFDMWISRRIDEYKFTATKDFCSNLSETPSSSGGCPATEYCLSTSMAKQICMLENNEQGKRARLHFIDCEERLKALPTKTSEDDMLAELTIPNQRQGPPNLCPSATSTSFPSSTKGSLFSRLR
jgi:phage anti-repressor protein